MTHILATNIEKQDRIPKEDLLSNSNHFFNICQKISWSGISLYNKLNPTSFGTCRVYYFLNKLC